MSQSSPPIKFTKMHGLGNDFVVIDAIRQQINPTIIPVKRLGNRFTGIGFDQMLLIEPAKNADFFCRIFNSDGSEAEQCGNGLRCVARFVHEYGLHAQKSMRIETAAGIFPITIQDYDNICVTMGTPQIQDKLIDFTLKHNPHQLALSTLSIGNPHAVAKVAAIDTIAADRLGQEISTLDYFPAGANVGFMQVLNPTHIRLRTYERGAGETNACGSNACAATAAGIVNGWLQHRVQVDFKLGSLLIEWQGNDEPMYMTGSAVNVFEGVF